MILDIRPQGRWILVKGKWKWDIHNHSIAFLFLSLFTSFKRLLGRLLALMFDHAV